MQKLIFESAWEKTIAPADREKIISVFHETKNEGDGTIKFIPLKTAVNHEESLLITVLIHNFTKELFPLQGLRLTYTESTQSVAEYDFSFPHVTIESRTSMPWTFIFPKTSWIREPSFENSGLVFGN